MLKNLFKHIFVIIVTVIMTLSLSSISIGTAKFIPPAAEDLQQAFIQNNITITNSITLNNTTSSKIDTLRPINVGVIDFFNLDSFLFTDNYIKTILPKDPEKYDNNIVHGSLVSNTILGINPNVNIIAYQMPSSCNNYHILCNNYANAIEDLVVHHNVKIINISAALINYNIGANGYGTPEYVQYSKEQIEELNTILENELQSLLDRHYDFLIVKGAGNQSHQPVNPSYSDKQNETLFDENSNIVTSVLGTTWDMFSGIENQEIKNHILVVGGVDRNNCLSIFSNYDQRVDVLAPANDFALYHNQKDFSYVSNTSSIKTEEGTSLATPVVSSLAACIYAKQPNLTCPEIKNKIVNSANTTAYDGILLIELNKKIVNFENALK